MVNAQEWLDRCYPESTRKTITNLEVTKFLEKELNLSDFTNLTELVIAPKRNWEDFYNWLNINIVDINAKGPNKCNIKLAKRSEYPNLISSWNCTGYLMNSLECHLGKTLLGYTSHDYQNQYKVPVLPCDETKSFFQLANGNITSFKCGYSFTLPDAQNILNEYEKLNEEILLIN